MDLFERNMLHRQSVGHLRRQEAQKYGVSVFMGWVISQTNEQVNYSNYFGEGGQRFPGTGPPPTF